MKSRFVLGGVLALAASSSLALGGAGSPSPKIVFEPLERALLSDCASPSDPGPCRVRRAWPLDELLARRDREASNVWRDGNELTFVFDADGDDVTVCCGLQAPLSRFEHTNTWVLTVRVPNAARAVLSYGFLSSVDGRFVGTSSPSVWRGPLAPPAPEFGVRGGDVRTHILTSASLGERQLTVYTPPDFDAKKSYRVVYAADGQAVPSLAAAIDPLIVNGELPPLLIVGVHSEVGTMENNLRGKDYLVGLDDARFAQHEAFFTREVREWAERTLGASRNPSERAVFGVSNGAAFAITMGLKHPTVYRSVLAFSFAWHPNIVAEPRAGVSPRFYLQAGTLEKPFLVETKKFASRLAGAGVEKAFRERVGGHDSAVWTEEFISAVTWAFKTRP